MCTGQGRDSILMEHCVRQRWDAGATSQISYQGFSENEICQAVMQTVCLASFTGAQMVLERGMCHHVLNTATGSDRRTPYTHDM